VLSSMQYKSLALCFVISVSVLAGCATPYGLGQTALRQGRYGEAVSHFEQVLAQDPNRLDALVGLGVSRYKLTEFGEAIDALDRVVAQAPEHADARLYLGLSYLRTGEDGLAEDQLNALLGLTPEPRLAAQLDRALQVLRSDQLLSEEMRGFLVASLEDEAEWAREVRELRLERQRVFYSSYYYPRSIIFLRSHRHCR
jgi:tetratricopeptide (TPR) repeat protein